MGDSKNLYLLTGSNLGDREAFLRQALAAIEVEVGSLVKKSALYQTQAWGITDQPDFLNQALFVQTRWSPFVVLELIKAIEKNMGRTEVIRWGERIIDIDILFYDNIIVESPSLTIPHPRFHERNFAMAPLAEIAPDLRHPALHKTVVELLAESTDDLKI